jgi:hypothetical protein
MMGGQYPKYSTGKTFVAYSVSLKNGIVPVEFKCIRFGKIHLFDGSIHDRQKYFLSFDAAERRLEGLRSEERQRKLSDQKPKTLGERFVKVLLLRFAKRLSLKQISEALTDKDGYTISEERVKEIISKACRRLKVSRALKDREAVLQALANELKAQGSINA